MFPGMLKPPIIFRYIIAEIVRPFLISIFVFTGILFMARSLRMVDMVINKNVPIGDIIILFSYIIPRFLEIAIPMSLLLAVILAFGRFSSDSELVVIRATGISVKRLAAPVLMFSAGALVLTTVITFWIRPWANHQLGVGMFQIARKQASSGLLPGIFNDLGQLTVYGEKITAEGQMTNVIISDYRNPDLPRTFFAKHGRIVSNQTTRTLNLQLYNGSIQEGSGRTFNATYFEVTGVSLPYKELMEEAPSRGGKRAPEMYIDELISAIAAMEAGRDDQTAAGKPEEAKADPKAEAKRRARSLARYQVELHKRLALPVSCLCIALIAMALGIQPSRGGHTWGAPANVAMGISLILFYYVLFALAGTLGEQVKASPAVLWAPNVVFALLGVYLIEKTGSEQWLAVSEALGDKLTWLAEKMRLTGAET